MLFVVLALLGLGVGLIFGWYIGVGIVVAVLLIMFLDVLFRR